MLAKLERLVFRLRDRILPRAPRNAIPEASDRPINYEEIVSGNRLELVASHPRVLALKNRVVRISIADPGIVSPIVVDPWSIVLWGKIPGATTLTIWDEEGNIDSMEVSVQGKDRVLLSELKAAYDRAAREAVKSPPARRDPDPPPAIINALSEVQIWSGGKLDVLGVPQS